jgi:Mce-associated membrane protein
VDDRRRGDVVLPVVIVMLIGLLALLVVLLLQAAARNARDDRRDAVAAAARSEALAVTTISYQTANADLDRILAGATGQLRSQFAEQKPHFADTLQPEKSESKGDVLSVGVVSSSASAAQAVVAADATVTTTPAGKPSQSVLKHYRMVLRLVKVHGRWLVSDIAFAGAPQ